MRKPLLSVLGLCLVVFFVVAPAVVHYRMRYDHFKRLRVVTTGKVYRSGQLSEAGLREAIRQLGLKAVVNLQDETPEPIFPSGKLESEVCAEEGTRFIFLPPDTLSHKKATMARPRAVDEFLRIMDDSTNYPVLLHCRAGLHRTGTLVALYRIEYESWPCRDALIELQDNGFGRSDCNVRNDYLSQYLIHYQPRTRSARGDLPALLNKDSRGP